jgi:hypothetical protein
MDGQGAPSTDLVAAAAARDLGPLVRRRWGDALEIFEDSPLGEPGRTLLMVAIVVVMASVSSFTHGSENPWGPGVALLLPWLVPLLPALSNWRKWRRFSASKRLEELTAARSGEVVRVVGTIEACGTLFHAPSTNRSVVYARTLFSEAGYRGRPSPTAREEIRAVPFRIRLDSGSCVQVKPADVLLADPTRQLAAVSPEVLEALGAALRGPLLRREPTFLQATLAPGDRVEAVGQLTAEVNVRGEAAPARGSPLVHTLVAPTGGTVCIRRAAC